MIWTNYHCHSTYCDGKAVLEDFVKEALQINMPILGFSGHGPVPFPSVWNMEKEDLPKYLADVDALKEKYAGQIQIYKSLEIDYIEGKLNANSKIFDCGLDYKISSVHYMAYLADGTPWTIDGPPEEWHSGLEQVFVNDAINVLKEFTRQSIEMMELGGFDIIGHIDKSFQNGHKHFDADHSTNIDCVNSMLKAAKENDIIVEINTKTFNRMDIFYPHQYFFKTLKDLNVPITINSDSHHPKLITAGMERAASALLEDGIDETFEFINGQWVACNLTNKGIILNATI